MKHNLLDILDIPRLQSALDSLYLSSGIPSAIIDTEGGIHTASGWQDVCTKFHRVHPEARKLCNESSLYCGSNPKDAAPSIHYKCPHGLVDSAIPIIVDGEHIGSVFSGQLFLEDPDLDFFRRQARIYGFDEEKYMEAVKRVPIITERTLRENLAFIAHLTGMLAEMGMKRSKEREIEQRLRESEENYRTLFRLAGDGILVLELNGKLAEVNESLASMHGYSVEEMVGMNVRDLCTPGTLSMVPERIRRLLSGEMLTFEVEHYHKDGHVFPMEVSASPIFSGGKLYIQCFHRDITERKKAENQLRLQSEIAKNLAEGIYIIRLDDGIIVYANPKFEEMFGYAHGELNGKIVETVIAPGDKTPEEVKREVTDCLANTGEWHGEIKTLRKDGSHFWCHANVSRFDHPDFGNVAISIHADTTERKRAEDLILKNKEDLRRLAGHLQENIEEERKRIAREIHDELGQQLAALKNDLAWAESHVPGKSLRLIRKIRSMAELVDATSRSVYSIIHKLRPLLLDDLGLPEAIDWQVAEFRKRTGIVCELDAILDDLDLDPDAVTGVFRLLQEMLTNVGRHSGAKRCRVRIRKRRDEISLLVADDGIGAPIDRIDDRASFGLLGMRERARALGGRFRIRGIPGKGTVVAVLIPIRASGGITGER